MIGARLCRVSGRVQGVCYRAATRRRALELGLAGHARNLPDGRVEVHAEGEAGALAALCDWLWDGPEAARVSSVACQPVPPVGYGEFTTG
ncbi:MAG: acylphosphatase [Gammaproteobacteria bacterium]